MGRNDLVDSRPIRDESGFKPASRDETERLKTVTYVLAHDLRAPLRAIRSNLELWHRKNSLADDQNAKFALEGAERMQLLIDELLLYVQSGHQTTEGSDETADLGRAVTDACGCLSLLIKDRGAKIECGSLPFARGRRQAFMVLFQNLIANAINVTADTAPLICITAEPDGDKSIIRVGDNGPGIDPKKAATLFEPFARGAGYAGTGLGLAIVRNFVESMGGRVWAENSPSGATFCFTVRPPAAAEMVPEWWARHNHEIWHSSPDGTALPGAQTEFIPRRPPAKESRPARKEDSEEVG